LWPRAEHLLDRHHVAAYEPVEAAPVASSSPAQQKCVELTASILRQRGVLLATIEGEHDLAASAEALTIELDRLSHPVR
jgi:hypothetical protein